MAHLAVPAIALLLAALPAWTGLDVSLPRPLDREFQTTLLFEAPRVVASRAASLPRLVTAPRPRAGAPNATDAQATVPAARPTITRWLAVIGVGVQGLVVRSEPGGGDRILVVNEGTDLRDLGQESSAEGRTWKRVAHPDGGEGWVAAEFLLPWDGTDREARTAAMLARSAGAEAAAQQALAWKLAPPEIRSITPDQLHDGQTLSSWEAYSACAPAATVAFSRARGRELTLDQSVEAARKVGWNAALGMPGPRAEIALLASLGIPAHMRGESADEIDWDKVISDVQAGIPVMVVTSRHYFVAEGYDPETGKLDFGNSALVLAGARHQRWFTPEQVGWLGYGEPFTTIHLGPGPQPTEFIRAQSFAY